MSHRPHFDVNEVMAAYDRAVAATIAAAGDRQDDPHYAAQTRMARETMRAFWRAFIEEINGPADDDAIAHAVANLTANMLLSCSTTFGGGAVALNKLLIKQSLVLQQMITGKTVCGPMQEVYPMPSGRA